MTRNHPVRTVVELLEERRRPDAGHGYTFLLDGEHRTRTLSFAQLAVRARAIAARLSSAGLAGRAALLLYPPGLDYIEALFGCMYAGVIAVPAYPPDPARLARTLPRIQAISRDSRAGAALTTAAIAGFAPGIIETSSELGRIPWIATDTIEDAAASDAGPRIDPEDIAFIQYTSGSTGTPRGVVLSHRNLIANSELIYRSFGNSRDDCAVIWLPPYHDMGLIGGILQPLYGDFRGVLMSPVAFLERPLRWLSAIERFRGTLSGGPNFAFDLCLRKTTAAEREALDLSSWKVAFCGAEPIRAATLDRFSAAFGVAGFTRRSFYPCYGLAEATLLVTGAVRERGPVVVEVDRAAFQANAIRPPSSAGAAVALVSSGRVHGQSVAIVDPVRRVELPDDTVGEIWVEGASVARGYWHHPELSSETFGARLDGRGPYLRTGDLGFRRAGELYITGRSKDLIIHLGRNHYPQDIESTVEACHPGVRPGATAVFATGEGEAAARIVVMAEVRGPAEDLDAIVAQIRNAVAVQHELQVHDVVLVPAGVLLKTSSGKVQRRPCRDALEAGKIPVLARDGLALGDRPYRAPHGPTERKLAELWTEILGLAAPSAEDDFFDLGGHSLQAGELLVRISEAFGVALSPGELFGAPRIAALAHRIDDVLAARRDPAAGRAGGAADRPLAFVQQRFWFLQRLAPGSAALHLSLALELDGALDADALRTAVGRLVDRHDNLRSSIQEEDGVPCIAPARPPALDFLALEAPGDAAADPRLAAALSEAVHRPFDLARGPLARFLLIRCGATRHVLSIVVHHLMADGWSMGLLVEHLFTAYREVRERRAPAPRPAGPSYLDFARAERERWVGARLEAELAYWRGALDGAPLDTALPFDHRAPAGDGATAVVTATLPGALCDALTGLARRHGVTRFAALLAIFNAALARWTGQAEHVIATMVADRSRAGSEQVIGCFLNFVLLRVGVAGARTGIDLLRAHMQRVREAFAHQECPLEEIRNRLRTDGAAGASSLFNVAFLLQNFRRPEVQVPGLVVRTLPADPGEGSLDLRVIVEPERDGLKLSFEYRRAAFEADTIARMMDGYRRLLAEIVAAPDRPLVELAPLPEAELAQLRRFASGPVQGGAATGAVHEWIARRAGSSPSRIAVEDGPRTMTYGELVRRARSVAAALRRRAAGPDVPVGLLCERSLDLVVGVLGILEAGAAYLPLDPSHPAERHRALLAAASVQVVVTTRPFAAAELAADTLCIDELPADLVADRGDPVAVAPGNLAYVTYTSGSTGEPKGVMVSHGALANHTRSAIEAYGITAADRVLQFASLAFDASAEEIFPALAAGATLVLRGPDDLSSVATFLAGCAARQLTVLDLPTAYFHELVHGMEAEDLALPASVRLVILGGERVLANRVDSWLSRVRPGVRLVNTYGPTEATVVATRHDVVRASGPDDVPIGVPIADATAWVVDAAGQLCPIGAPGELLLGGAGIARGYIGRPELTAERFLPDPWAAAPGGRLYATGDRVRWRRDGALEYLGRLDDQVKIRGFRVEPGEIEAVAAGHGEIREAAVIAAPSGEGQHRLILYFAAERANLPIDELAGFLRARLPGYLVPTAYRQVERLPRTAGGKVDRRRLPAEVATVAARPHAAPETRAQAVVCEIFADVLGIDPPSIHDDFFELGGHSLLVGRVAARIRSAFDVELPFTAIFELRTAARIAERLAAGASAVALPPIRAVDRTRDLPLSFPQERIWFLEELAPESMAYNVHRAIRLRGRLSTAAIEHAFTEIVRRHEILRSVFPAVDGQPVQRVMPPYPVRVPVVEAPPDGDPEAWIAEHSRREARRPFDLAHGPMLRLRLLRVAERDHVLLLTEHHLVHDGWTQGVLAREFMALYDAHLRDEPSPLAELPIQYGDFAFWQRNVVPAALLADQVAYWTRQLADAPPVIELPTDRPRARVQSFRGSHRSLRIPGALADGLRRLGRQTGSTLFMTLLAGYATLLRRLGASTDLSIGTVIANRRFEETEGLLGMILNTVVLRLDLAGNPSIEALLGRVRQVCLGAYAHQDAPFGEVVKSLNPQRSLAHLPLYQVAFAFQDVAEPELALDGLEVEFLETDTQIARSDLTFLIIPMAEQRAVRERERAGSDLELHCEYNSDLFDAEAIDTIVQRYLVLLGQMVGGRERRIEDLEAATAEELRVVTGAWAVAEAVPLPDAPVHALIAAQAARTPGAIALEHDGRTLSYAELERRANRLARGLRGRGVGPDAMVPVMVERSIEMVVAVLGVLEAGAAYVPIDPREPAVRRNAILSDVGARLAIVGAGVDRSGLALEVIELPPEAGAGGDPDDDGRGRQAHRVAPDQLAYVIYTSGSTGVPKGVMVTHRALLNHTLVSNRTYRLAASDRMLQFASLAFDASKLEIFPILTVGGTLVLRTDEAGATPERLLACCRRWAITTLWIPTAFWHELVHAIDREHLALPPAIRLLIIGGELAQADRYARWWDTVGRQIPLWNAYGPSEVTIVNSLHEGREHERGRAMPIGRPIANTTAWILDGELRPVPPGVAGELCVGGVGLARGYLGRPELTAERFVPHPFGAPGERLYRTGDRARWGKDGVLEFVARAENHLKIRGYRVDPREVEAVLLHHPGIRAAYVAPREAAAGGLALVAFFVSDRPQHPIKELQAFLRERVPDYLVPRSFVQLDEFPRTPGGKVDPRRLPADAAALDAREHAPPRNPTETAIASAFAEVLGRDAIDIHDDFFDLGGHSLLVGRVLSRLKALLGVALPIASFFEHRTVAQIAEHLPAPGGAAAAPEPLAALPPAAEYLLSFAQQRLWFLAQLEPESSAYHIAGGLLLRGALDVAALERAFRHVIERQHALRTSIVERDGEPRARIAAAVEFALPVTDLRHLAREARLRAASELAHGVAVRPFDLARGPLLRAALYRLDDGEALLAIATHHIVSDEWSLGVLARELGRSYAAFERGAAPELAPLAVQYVDYAAWQRRRLTDEVFDRQLGFWRHYLAGAPRALELPADRPRPRVGTGQGGRIELRLPAPLTAAVREASRRFGVTPFMTLLAGYQVVLMRYSGQADVVIGTPVSNRPDPALEGVVGLFVDTVALRTRADDRAGFGELLRQTRDSCLAAFANQDLPFERIVDALQPERDLGRSPVFQAMFTLVGATPLDLGALSVERVALHAGAAKFDISVALEELGDEIAGTIEYRADLFDAETIERIAGSYRVVLEAATRDPDRPLARLPLLTDRQRITQLETWNDTARLVDRRTVVDLIEQQARRSPDATALWSGARAVSYRELVERAAALAARLAALGVGPDDRVAMYLPRSIDMVVAMLGILGAGAAYVPLDPGFPARRIADMLDDARPAAIVTDRASSGKVASSTVPVVDVAAPGPGAEPVARRIDPDHLAYVLYTSGSTGRPKGVAVSHANLRNFLLAMDDQLPVGERRTWLALTSISFDISILELVWPLTRGFEVVISGREPARAPAGAVTGRAIDFSLFYFANDELGAGPEKYRLLLEGARLADERGFAAVWTPERHFHEFGGIFPNPGITGAALAAATRRIAIRAGSLVSPLHNTVRIAEDWSVIDNLSGGRVGISFAPGWVSDDFVLAPERYGDRKRIMLEQLDQVRRLWRGETVVLRNGAGEDRPVAIRPRPVQPELPVWLTTAGAPASFELAGELGANLLTHLLGQDLASLGQKIERYRRARQHHGHAGPGRVTLMVHTFIGDDLDEVRATVRAPLSRYLRSSVDLVASWARSLGKAVDAAQLSPEDLDTVIAEGFDRFFEQAGLFGTPETCLAMVARLQELGVDEIACLVDFGVATDVALRGIERLARLRESVEDARTARSPDGPAAELARHDVSHLQCTPSQAGMLLLDAAPALARLDAFLVGGEALPPRLASRLREATGAQIFNMYGPTETTIWSTLHAIAGPDAPVRIGRPIANTSTYVLDPELEPVPVGVAGELYIGGAGVARGYLGAAALTAERFLPDPFAGAPGGRMYRTGDICGARADGALEFLGRGDHQVKIRGHRIELGDIEAGLARLPGVRQVAVSTARGATGDLELVAYLAGDGELVPEALDAELRRALPDYMVPAAFVQLPALPLTPNGKIDRKALATSGAAPLARRRAARTRELDPGEEVLAAIWSEVLGVRELGPEDDFFALGGNSLSAAQMVARIRKTFRVELALRAVFEAPRLDALARRIELERAGGPAAALPAIPRIERGGVLPLAFAQERLWFLDQLEPGSPLYNLSLAVRIDGRLDLALLEAALGRVVARHEALRTRIVTCDGRGGCEIVPELAVPIAVDDLRGLPHLEREREVARIAQREAQRPFDLTTAPLMRLRVIRCGAEQQLVVWTVHHIVTDRWSMGLLVGDLVRAYAELASGATLARPALPIQYVDFAAWQRGWLDAGVAQRDLAYWAGVLTPPPPVLDLAIDRERPQRRTSRGAIYSVDVPDGLIGEIAELARRHRATSFMTLLAAWKIVLSRYTGEHDIVVGTPVANRTDPQLEAVVGFFLNTVALRTDLADDPSFEALLARVRDGALAAFAHASLPFEQLVRELNPPRDERVTPIFQVMFAAQNVPMPEVALPGLAIQPVRLDPGTSTLDLSLSLENAGRELSFQYSTDVLSEAMIARIAASYLRLLQSIVAQPARRISELSMVTDEERRGWLAASAGPRVARDLRGLDELFEDQARRTPDATAIVHGGSALSYRELDQRAEAIADHLRAGGLAPEEVVALAAAASADAIAAIVGILKAGGVVAPFDPGAPETWTAAGRPIPRVLGEPELAAIARTARGTKATRRRLPGGPRAAYLIHTSGTSGVPKGVLLTHEGIVNQILGEQVHHRPAADDRVLLASRLVFDMSIAQIFSALVTGACLAIADPARFEDAPYLVELVRRERVSVACFVPSLIEVLLSEAGFSAHGCPALRAIFSGGEALSPDLVERLRAAIPAALFNCYGPTEATIEATISRLDGGGALAHVPIGRPIDNVRCYVVDRAGQPAPVGVPGELYIAGSGVARGYAHDPAATAERFVPDAFSPEPGARSYATGDLVRRRADGALEFLGRADGQVKIRGFRLELGGIERAVRERAAARAVAVLAQHEGARRRLVAFLEADALPPVRELRARLAEALPPYAVPSLFVRVPEMPRLPSGKIDQRRLLALADEPAAAREDIVPPRSATERRLHAIWRELLEIPAAFGATDNFFDLGGHSLLVTRMAARIAQDLGRTLAIGELFELATIERIAHVLDGGARTSPAIDLAVEAALPADVAPGEVRAAAGEPREILLTGATGFVGGFVLAELLRSPRARVHCLVRAGSAGDARDRLVRSLHGRGLDLGADLERVGVVVGDLSLPGLGLAPAVRDRLAHELDAIVHNGAWVHLHHPYEVLRSANVASTVELLRLAGRGRTKPFHYVSTLAVFPAGTAGRRFSEADDASPALAPAGGYNQTKWVSELLVLEARRRGIPASIHRLGRIAGHSVTGHGGSGDLIEAMVRGCLELGALPELAMAVELTPVDFVGRALAHLVRAQLPGATYHLANPQLVDWDDISHAIRSVAPGVATAAARQWYALASSSRGRSSALAPWLDLFGFLAADREVHHAYELDCAATTALLADAGIRCPGVDRGVMARYVARHAAAAT